MIIKYKYSIFSYFLIGFTLVYLRVQYVNENNNFIITDWDSFGYYMYLPSFFIYHDYKELNWLKEADEKYKLTGGELYQAHIKENGNYVFKYQIGVSLLQAPFFSLAHIYAKNTDYLDDGFSYPYQLSIAIAGLFYGLIGILIIIISLSYFFSDKVIALSCILVFLGTNFIQYSVKDAGMTHVYVFFLFALLLFFTIRWHKKRSIKNTIAIGFLLGIIAITRITDLIVFLIPLLWGVSSILELKEKIKFIINNRTILLCLVLSFILALLPQLIYWKMSYGSWIYNTGSKWNFLTPHFRVLIGGEKGLFIYTPITILFLIGLFYIRNKPFSVAILWFSILNAYILLSWHDWTYAASYACRAFVQSYAVMIFLTSLVVHEIFLRKNKILFFLGALYFIGVNLFQIKQYNEGIIHYHKNNFKYYSQIYLNSTPTPLQLSLLDTDDFIFFSSGKPRQVLKKNNIDITVNPNEKEIINKFFVKEIYYKISMVIKTSDIWNTNIYAKSGEKTVSFRLNRFGVNEFEENLYEFYFLPTNSGELEIGISSKYGCNANIKDFIVEEIR